MNQGYVKLWRKSLKSSVWDNHNLWRFWTWCLMKATYTARIARVGFQDISLEPGQFIFGRKRASEETGLSEQTIRTVIDSLRKSKNLTIKPTNKFSIISIVNWAEYQDESTNNLTNNQPTTNQQLTTNKKVKNVKKAKEDKNNIYGEFKNVKLSKEEYGKLKEKFNNNLPEMIERLSEYMASKGKKYSSHYATILSWDRKNGGASGKVEKNIQGNHRTTSPKPGHPDYNPGGN